jgi:hypothetical protein
MKKLNIEVGKKYLGSDDNTYDCVEFDGDDAGLPYKFVQGNNKYECFWSDSSGNCSGFSIVSEVVSSIVSFKNNELIVKDDILSVVVAKFTNNVVEVLDIEYYIMTGCYEYIKTSDYESIIKEVVGRILEKNKSKNKFKSFCESIVKKYS